MKKILSLLLAVIMAFSIPCTAFAAEATPEGEIISTFIFLDLPVDLGIKKERLSIPNAGQIDALCTR